MTLELISVASRRESARFVDLPFQLYSPREHRQWIPPLRMTVHDALDQSRPFYHDADRALFRAVRNGRDVGRIAAIENRVHNRDHKDRVGFWGFLELEDNDPLLSPRKTTGLKEYRRWRMYDGNTATS